MKKLGFTLAEVLITLGIIGVVAALTAPALVQNAGSAQIGPKLAKAVSTFETANEKMLMELSLSSIQSLGGGDEQSRTYGDQLSNYMKMSFFDNAGGTRSGVASSADAVLTLYDGSSAAEDAVLQPTFSGIKYLSKDGFLYSILVLPAPVNHQEPLHKQLGGMVGIDINGIAEPNRAGKDAFVFYLMQDGTLCPCGGGCHKEFVGLNTVGWDEDGNDSCNATEVDSGATCAGSIFENNLKVIYQ